MSKIITHTNMIHSYDHDFAFRDGNNFIVKPLDWQNRTALAFIVTIAFLLGSVALHFLFSKVHLLRKKLCFYLRLRSAILPLIP